MQSDFSEPRVNERQRDVTSAKSSYRSAQTNASVRKHDTARDCDLGKFIIFLHLLHTSFVMYLHKRVSGSIQICRLYILLINITIS